MTPGGEMRIAAVATARMWIGTPHVHGASLRGAGADCLGLIRGVWRELFGAEPATVTPYPVDWASVGVGEVLRDAVEGLMRPQHASESRPGDVALMRLRRGGPAQHLGLLAEDRRGRATLIHAHARHGVVEAPLGEAWRLRIVAALAFPEGDDAWRR